MKTTCNFILPVISLFLLGWVTAASAQTHSPLEVSERGATVYLSKDSVSRIRFITLVQFWARQTQMNPGSVYKNRPAETVTDLSLRRGSIVTVIQPNPRLLMLFNYGGYANAANEGEVSFELTDAYAEYKVSNRRLSSRVVLCRVPPTVAIHQALVLTCY